MTSKPAREALADRLIAESAKELSETYLCYHGAVMAKFSLLYAKALRDMEVEERVWREAYEAVTT
jgi:hypothetical protein